MQTDAFIRWLMFGAERVRGAELGLFQSLSNVAGKNGRRTQTDQAAERAFAIRRGGVNEHAGYRALLAEGSAMNTFSDQRALVAIWLTRNAYFGTEIKDSQIEISCSFRWN